MPRKKMPKFSVKEFEAGDYALHPEYPSYNGVPWVEEEFTTGEHIACPHCGQRMVPYARKFNKTEGKVLKALYALASKTGKVWHRLEDFVPKGFQGGDMGRMRDWGLCVSPPPDPFQDKKNSGVWGLTETGIAFVEGRVAIPARVVHYLQQHIAVCGPPMTISQFTDGVAYSAIMGDE